MITFSELSIKQRALVVQLLEIFPESKNTGTISLSKIKQYVVMVKEGKAVQPIHPMFLYGRKEFRTGTRGVYILPLPSETDNTVFDGMYKQHKNRNSRLLTPFEKCDTIKYEFLISIDEFDAECREAGILN